MFGMAPCVVICAFMVFTLSEMARFWLMGGPSCGSVPTDRLSSPVLCESVADTTCGDTTLSSSNPTLWLVVAFGAGAAQEENLSRGW
jgi:hypothetical protein